MYILDSEELSYNTKILFDDYHFKKIITNQNFQHVNNSNVLNLGDIITVKLGESYTYNFSNVINDTEIYIYEQKMQI